MLWVIAIVLTNLSVNKCYKGFISSQAFLRFFQWATMSAHNELYLLSKFKYKANRNSNRNT